MITFLLSVTCLLISMILHFKKVQIKRYNEVPKLDFDFYCDILFLSGILLFFIGMTNMYAVYLMNIGFIHF